MMKGLFMFEGSTKSKTMWFALGLAVLGVVEMNLGIFEPYMTRTWFGAFSIAVGIAVAVLRVITTMPLDEK